MNALLLCGSAAQSSHTRALLEHLAELFDEQGVQAQLWDLAATPLPFILPEYHRDPSRHPDELVRKFVSEVAESAIVLLGTPLYHGSYSGTLKNALDHLAGDALAGKWVGLVGNAGGLRASHVEFSHLRQVVNTMGGYCAQTQIGTCRDDYETTANGYVLHNQDMKQRCQRLVTELVTVVV